MAVVGSGDYRYERVPSWPNMPKYWSFGAASDGAVNSQDEVHIYSRGAHPLTVWDTDGNFISSWGEGTMSANPHGIYIAPNDNVWLVDRDYHVATEYTPGGETLRTLGNKLQPSPSFTGMPFNMPSGLAIAPNGELFVSDGYGGHRVHKFSAEGDLLLSWGKQGTGPSEFALVHNILGRQEQPRDGLRPGERQGPELRRPRRLYRRMDRYAEARRHLGPRRRRLRDRAGSGQRRQPLDAGGRPHHRWRGNEGAGKGTLLGGHGLCVDSQGSIYVTEIGQGERVSKFVRV